jgi:hypothetical protein
LGISHHLLVDTVSSYSGNTQCILVFKIGSSHEPTLLPLATIPVANPRRFVNHRPTQIMGGKNSPEAPSPYTIPCVNMMCQNSVLKLSMKIPSRAKKDAGRSTLRGPTMSTRTPLINPRENMRKICTVMTHDIVDWA